MKYVYRGLTTGRLYSQSSVLTDASGNPVTVGTLGGETVVAVGTDGGIRRGVAGAPPPTDPYGPSWVPSDWEKS